MKIKAKLTLGVGLLFALIILLAVVSIRQVHRLSNDSRNILTANYNSLDYARNMLDALQNGPRWEQFDNHLVPQEQNITEVGEAEMTQQVRQYANQMRQHGADSATLRAVYQQINGIMRVNLEAIQRKSAVAAQTADNAAFWISIIGTVCFLIAFTLLFNLPANIANPIQALTGSIQQIAAGNYTQRVHFQSGSEFGQLADSFNVMAQKLEEYNNSNVAQLMTEKKRVETLINILHDPVIGLDEHKKVLFANAAALQISGLQSGEIIGKPALELSLTNDLIRSLLQPIWGEKADISPKNPLKIYANGKESFFEKEVLDITITPMGEQTPRHIGYFVLLRNITAYKELDTAKTNFIATISHEFKTPIASIKMSLQLLENGQIGPLNAEQQSLLHSIREDTGRLLGITGELLHMTQVETGNIQLAILPTDAAYIVQRAVAATANQAAQKHLRIEIQAPATLPPVLADADKTTWVMTNLLANAIQYSHDHDSVTLRLFAADGQVHFVVQDTGQGIAPNHLARVFDRYFRIPGSHTEGTGLGLAISKEFVEAQGGRIGVASDLGAGSTFTVSLQAG